MLALHRSTTGRKGEFEPCWTSIPFQLRWLVLRLSAFRPTVNRIIVSALLDGVECSIEASLAFAVV